MKEFIEEERRILEMKNIHELRAVGKRIGVRAATTHGKHELINQIIEIRFGSPKNVVFETRGRPSKQSDTDVYYNSYPAFDFGKVFAAASKEKYVVEKGPEVEGIVELHSDGFGMLHVGGFFVSKDDLYIPISIIKKYHLRDGDLIKAKVKGGTNSIGVASVGSVVDVLLINEKKPGNNSLRNSFFEMTPIYPDSKFELSGDSGLSLLNVIAPIGKGQRTLIVGGRNTGKSSLMFKLANSIKNTHDDTYVLPVFLSKSYDEISEIKLNYKHFFAFTTFDQDCTANIRTLSLAIARGIRMVEENKNAVILIDDLNSALKAYEECIDKQKGGALSATQSIKKLFGIGTNTVQGGSLTIIGAIDGDLAGGKLLLEDLYQLNNMQIILDHDLSNWHVSPAVDIVESKTQKSSILQSKEENEIALKIRSLALKMSDVEARAKFVTSLNNCNNLNEINQILK